MLGVGKIGVRNTRERGEHIILGNKGPARNSEGEVWSMSCVLNQKLVV